MRDFTRRRAPPVSGRANAAAGLVSSGKSVAVLHGDPFHLGVLGGAAAVLVGGRFPDRFHLSSQAAGLGVVERETFAAVFIGCGGLLGGGFARGAIVVEERFQLDDVALGGRRGCIAGDRFSEVGGLGKTATIRREPLIDANGR